jgi:hypothetical protein
MGIHYGIYNKTKKHKVFYCWKRPFCDCHLVMHAYHWDGSDEIYVLSQNYRHNFIGDEKTGKMILTNNVICRESNDNAATANYDAMGFDLDQKIKQMDHIPIWQNNKCIVCDYYYDPEKILMDKNNLIKPKIFPEVNIYHII